MNTQLVCCCFALVWSAHARAQTLVRSVNGPVAGAQFGRVSIVVPDQNADGFKDLLLGAPGFNGGRGAVYCVSGAYLANGSGASTLWSIAPATAVGDQFGFALANVGDVTNDGVADFLVGQPGHDGGGTDGGAVRLISGSTHTVGPELYGPVAGARMGSSLTSCTDVNGDGKRDAAVGAPGPTSNGSLMFILKSTGLAAGGALSAFNLHSTTYAGGMFATSLTSGFDYDGDGYEELVIGGPESPNGTALNAGAIVILSLAPTGALGSSYASPVGGERFGQSVSMGQDYDGDGAPDIVVGAPNSPDANGFEVGRVVVISGLRLFNHTPPYEIYSFPFGTATPPASHADPNPHFHFGAAVHACADLNNDGVGEILAGAPDFFSQGLTGWNYRGLVRVFSGATGTTLASIAGAATDRLGQGLAGAVNDLDGDGFKEFAVAGALSDAGGTDSGVLRCYRLFPVAPVAYCTGKVNSLGCTPTVGYSGSPSASSTAPYLVTGSSFVNQKNGLLFYSHAPTAVVFQAGTKCVANPTVRTTAQNSGGSTGGPDCSGAYSFDFSAWTASGVDPSLVAGSEVFAQYWSRDPATPSHTSLSNALRFVLNP